MFIKAQYFQTNCRAANVATKQVNEVLKYVTKAGLALQSGTMFKLLIVNVTRRVLSIIRQAAEASIVPECELEHNARHLIASLDAQASGDPSDDDVELEGTPTRGLGRGLPIMSDEGVAGMATEQPERKIVRFSTEKVETSSPIAVRKWQSTEEDSAKNSADASSLLSDCGSGGSEMPRVLSRVESTTALEDQTIHMYLVDFRVFLDRAKQGIEAFLAELSNVNEELCKRAPRQLHELDTILTLGTSVTTSQFLLEAVKAIPGERHFKVIIIEGQNPTSEKEFAKELRALGAKVDILPCSSCFAAMSTCTKVIVGVESVLANGGLIAPTGTYPICVAAKHFSVPVIVVTMILKIVPYYPADNLCTSLVKLSRTRAEEMPWSTFTFPGEVLPLDSLHAVDHSSGAFEIQTHAPLMEYVPPSFVSLFATNQGEYTVPQIHRIVRDNYDAEDSHL
jgi:translation initiation factor eIF-2B subunit beta